MLSDEKLFKKIIPHLPLETISKGWIRVQGKERGGEKAAHTREYVSILSRPATPPWALRRLFGMVST